MVDVCDVPVISSVCDVAGDAAGALVSAPFDWLAQSMGHAASWMFEAVWNIFDSTTMVDVTSSQYTKVCGKERRGTRGYPGEHWLQVSGHAAEAALPLAEVLNGHLKRILVKVRPVDRAEMVLAIDGLPDEEVAQPLFTCGTNNQVGVRQIACV